MKKTQWIVLLRDIRKTWVSFLSIAVFVALGVAIFLGIKWSEPALGRAVDSYLDQRQYHDLQFSFPYGFTAEDVAAVADMDGVAAVEGAYNAYGTARVGNDRYILNIQSLTDTMDRATALEGALPAKADEMGVERLLANALGLKVGDRLSITALRGEQSYLKETEFTVTAIVEHPSYIRDETDYTRGFCGIGDGSADGYVLMAKDAFNTETFDGCYSQLLIRGTGLEELISFDDSYQQRVDELRDKIESLGDRRAALRSDGLYGRAQNEIADAESKLAQSEQELADAKQRLSDGEKEILDNEKKLSDGRRQYESGLAAYNDGAAELRDSRTALVGKLEKNGYPADIDAAEQELKADREKAVSTQNLLLRIQAQVNLYNQQPDAVDQAEIESILQDVLRMLGIPPEKYASLTAGELMDILDDSIEYLADYGSNDAVTETVNELLPWLGLTADEKGAGELRSRLELARAFAGLYVKDPSLPPDKDLQLVLISIIVIGTDPQLTGMQVKLRESLTQVDESIALADEALAGISEYRAGQKSLSDAADRLARSRRELASGEHKLAEGKQKLEQARQDIAEGEKKLAEYTAQLQDAKAELDGFIRYDKWTLQTRTDNPSVSSARFYAQSSRKMCYSMALLFVFVGLMVCFTSVTRNVNESQTITGVQKSLGFRSREILAHYMAYSLLAAVAGILAGYAIGYFFIEPVTNNAFSRLFTIGKVANVYTVPEALIIAVPELVLIALATWLPCRKLLRRPAVELMKGSNYAGGRTRFYEKWRVWQRMSLYAQTTVNNLMNDGARVIATLVGVAGCTALIVMSLSLQSSIQRTPAHHFEKIWTYDVSVVSDTAVPGGHEALERVLDECGVAYASVTRGAMYIRDETGAFSKADLLVPDDDSSLAGFIRLTDPRTGKSLPLTDGGIIVSRTYAKHHDLQVGDTLQLMDTNGTYHNCPVTGISQHYLSSILIAMSPAYYETIMGEAPQSNTLFLHYGDADANAVQQKLQATEGYFSMTDEYARWAATFTEASRSTIQVVYIGLSLSVTMALLVLLNLNIVCVNEKTNELVVMRINGFSVRAVKRYVYRDNIVLTLLGILAGIGIGLLLGIGVLNILQKSGDNFYTAPSLAVCLLSAGLAAAFSLLTNLIALRRVNTLSVSDLNRV